MDRKQKSAQTSCITNIDAFAINEAQLILAEKRTTLAVLRTGIAVFALPLSVLSFLIATSSYYVASEVLHFLVPVIILCLALGAFGAFLIIRSGAKIRRQEKMLEELKKKHTLLSKLTS
ncbi:MAG: hypothetical protein HZB23_02740 [Deltaproteobacteria bacterium]|nr:hypothetical protein [Deltaproteobacteria bacterium]